MSESVCAYVFVCVRKNSYIAVYENQSRMF